MKWEGPFPPAPDPPEGENYWDQHPDELLLFAWRQHEYGGKGGREKLYNRLSNKIHEICKEHYGTDRSTPSMEITDEIFPIIEPVLALESLPRARWWQWVRKWILRR